MTMVDTIRAKLESAFAPQTLDVKDDSASHAGHAGTRAGGESHFSVKIVSSAFTGLSQVERQRRVYQTLDSEMKNQIHALALKTISPEDIK